MTSSDIKQRAKDALSGNWFVAVIAGFIASLFGGISNSGISVEFEFSSEGNGSKELEIALRELGFTVKMINEFYAYMAVFAIVIMVYAFICLIIGNGICVGYANINLDIVDGRSASLGTLFGSFNRWGAVFVARLLTGLFVALWSLLLFIPGIIAAYSYSMVDFVLADNPDMSASEALRESKRIMRGNKWRLFCLDLSFIGWMLLCLFTLGIASLWVLPYTQVARAAFYREISA